MAKQTIRIGCGSGYGEDRLDLALDMILRGNVQYLGMDCLAERTLALAQVRRMEHPDSGWDLRLPAFTSSILPAALDKNVTIIGNMGAANSPGAAEYISSEAKKIGLPSFRMGVIEGDDVREIVRSLDPLIWETGQPVSMLEGEMVSANAYIGADDLVQALSEGANLVIGGRIADPSLFVAPIVAEFGIENDDWDRLGSATLFGHMLECGTHVTGGNFADPPYRVVPSFRRPSMPYAEVDSDGWGTIRKLDDTDGLLSVNTCKAQLAYEIGDPGCYITPDVCADFRNVTLEEVDGGIRLGGAGGAQRSDQLKVVVGMKEGFVGEGQVSYAGPGALERAELGASILNEWVADYPDKSLFRDLKIDLLGINSLHGVVSPEPSSDCPPYEVHLRMAVRTPSADAAAWASHCVEYLQIFGPAATSGHRKSVRPLVGMYSCLVPRDQVQTGVHIMSVGG